MAGALTGDLSPEVEQKRLEALYDYGILETAPEPAFDRVTRLAATLTEAPIALLSFVDSDRQWFKSRYGTDLTETPRDQSFCVYTFPEKASFVVKDTHADDRFAQNPLVTGAPFIRTYAGAPLVTAEGKVLGALCVLFDKVTPLAESQLSGLEDLAQLVMEELALRKIARRSVATHTAQRDALSTARQTEALLESVAAVAGVGGWEVDLERLEPIWTAYTREIHEVPADFVPNMDEAINFYAPEYRDMVTQSVEHCIATGQPFEFEAELITAKERRVWVRSVGRAVMENGKTVKLIGAFQDITKQKTTQETLSATLAEKQHALNALYAYQSALDEHAIVGITDARGTITFVNDKFCEISGYDEHELIGQNHRILNSGHHEQAFFEHMWKTIRHGQAWQGEICNRAKSGEEYWVNTTIVPIMDNDGKPEQFVSIRHDITSRIRTHKALAARTQQLETTSRRLEKELGRRAETAEKLQDSMRQAEAANIAKSQFLATMSHELRTPMNGIMGMLDLALRSELTASQTQQLETARQSAGILLQLLNDILDLSKLEEGQVEFEHIPFSPRALVDETRKFLQFSAEEKGLQLRADISDRVPETLEGDPTRTRQVLINLIGNAIKFSEDGIVDIRVDYDPDRADLTVDIQDYGIGNAPEHQPKLFQRFAQGDASTTRRIGGTGLGLAISQELVEGMGGTIGVNSTFGEGSTFSFTVRAAVREAPLVSEPASLTTQPAEAGASLRVLIAEDNAVNQMVIEAFARTAGHNCHLVSDGLEAVEALEAGDFDVILMDVQMPNMDGIDATKTIRARTDEKGQIPIIALTANAMLGDRDTYLAAGMTDYLSKPVGADALMAALERATAPKATARRA